MRAPRRRRSMPVRLREPTPTPPHRRRRPIPGRLGWRSRAAGARRSVSAAHADNAALPPPANQFRSLREHPARRRSSRFVSYTATAPASAIGQSVFASSAGPLAGLQRRDVFCSDAQSGAVRRWSVFGRLRRRHSAAARPELAARLGQSCATPRERLRRPRQSSASKGSCALSCARGQRATRSSIAAVGLPVPYISRLARVRDDLRDASVDALIVSSLPNLRYLTGFTGTAGAAIVRRGSACSSWISATSAMRGS